MKILLPVLALSIAAVAIAASKTSNRLPGTTGRYASPTVYEVEDGPGPDIGTLSTTVRAAKSGRKLKVRMSGIVDPSDTPVPIDASLAFDAKRRVRANSFLLGYYGAIDTQSARYRQKSRSLEFTLKSAAGANLLTTPIEGSVKYRCKFGRRTFRIAGNGSFREVPAGMAFPFVVNVSGKLTK